MSRLKGMLPNPIKRSVKRVLQNLWESIAYRLTRERRDDWEFQHVVFVCSGNICRSVFAECYLRSLVPEGTNRIESCGLDVGQGTSSPREAVQVAREFGIGLDMHCSKGLPACELPKADLIVPMEYSHYLRLSAMFPDYKCKIKLLRDFTPWPTRLMCNIYDPFGLGEGAFRRCFRGIQKALDGLKKHMVVVENK